MVANQSVKRFFSLLSLMHATGWIITSSKSTVAYFGDPSSSPHRVLALWVQTCSWRSLCAPPALAYRQNYSLLKKREVNFFVIQGLFNFLCCLRCFWGAIGSPGTLFRLEGGVNERGLRRRFGMPVDKTNQFPSWILPLIERLNSFVLKIQRPIQSPLASRPVG